MRRLHRLRAFPHISIFPRLPRNTYTCCACREIRFFRTCCGIMFSRSCCGIQVLDTCFPAIAVGYKFNRVCQLSYRGCGLISSLLSSLPHRFNVRAADHTTSLQTLIINCTICLITSSFRFYFRLSYLVSCNQVFNCKFSITIIQSLVKNRPENEKNLINTLTFCSEKITTKTTTSLCTHSNLY